MQIENKRPNLVSVLPLLFAVGVICSILILMLLDLVYWPMIFTIFSAMVLLMIKFFWDMSTRKIHWITFQESELFVNGHANNLYIPIEEIEYISYRHGGNKYYGNRITIRTRKRIGVLLRNYFRFPFFIDSDDPFKVLKESSDHWSRKIDVVKDRIYIWPEVDEKLLDSKTWVFHASHTLLMKITYISCFVLFLIIVGLIVSWWDGIILALRDMMYALLMLFIALTVYFMARWTYKLTDNRLRAHKNGDMAGVIDLDRLLYVKEVDEDEVRMIEEWASEIELLYPSKYGNKRCKRWVLVVYEIIRKGRRVDLALFGPKDTDGFIRALKQVRTYETDWEGRSLAYVLGKVREMRKEEWKGVRRENDP